jgi:dihydroflavonol-4-reductase
MVPDARFWAGRPVCVTGGTGFLGMHLVRELLAAGARVRVLALPCPADHPLLALKGIDCTFGDVCDLATVRSALAGCTTIFHVAGLVALGGAALERVFPVHVRGTQNVLEAAEPDATVVHTSSVVTVGASRLPDLLTEDNPFNLERLRVAYVQAKRAAEQLALAAAAAGQRVIVTNPSYLIGPDDRSRSGIGRFSKRFWTGRMPLAPPGGINLADVRDVARGHLLAAERGRSGQRYILAGENHDFKSFMGRMAEVAGLQPRALARVPYWALILVARLSEAWAWLRHADPYPALQHARMNRFFWFYRCDRAQRELGYRPRPLSSTLVDTHAWYGGHGRLRPRGLKRWWARPAPRQARAA